MKYNIVFYSWIIHSSIQRNIGIFDSLWRMDFKIFLKKYTEISIRERSVNIACTDWLIIHLEPFSWNRIILANFNIKYNNQWLQTVVEDIYTELCTCLLHSMLLENSMFGHPGIPKEWTTQLLHTDFSLHTVFPLGRHLFFTSSVHFFHVSTITLCLYDRKVQPSSCYMEEIDSRLASW